MKYLVYTVLAVLAVLFTLNALTNQESVTPQLRKSAVNKSILESFEEWKTKYNKQYSFEEEAYRLHNFIETYHFVKNFKSGRVVLTVGKFADLSEEEFTSKHLGHIELASEEEKVEVFEFSDFSERMNTIKYPTMTLKSWAGTQYDTPVLDQGQCGSCWAFSTAEQLSSLLSIDNPTQGMIVLSTQQIADCTYNNKDGCDGGSFSAGAKWVADNGIASLEDYPYFSGVTEHTGTCKDNVKPKYFPNKGYKNIAKGFTNFVNAVSAGPVAVAIKASQQVFGNYKSGVLGDECGDLLLDHAVLATGWSTDSQVAQIQNSWGTDWGQDGYVLLDGSVNNGNGACGFMKQMQVGTN